MKKKICEECQEVFEYEPNPNFPDKRKYCNKCSAMKKQAYEAGKNNPKPILPAEAVDQTEGISEVRHIFPDTLEFGPAGNRISIKAFTPAEMQKKLAEYQKEGHGIIS